MEFLVTATEPTTIWQLEGNEIFQLDFHDFSSISLIPENKLVIPKLPTELATRVLVHLFEYYLSQRDYHLALSCCRVDKYHLQKFYNGIYGRETDTPQNLFKRISRTFQFCEAIDDYLCTPCNEFQCIALRLARPGLDRNQSPLRPWQFGPYNVTEEIPPYYTIGYENITPFHLGDSVGDVVWLRGNFHRNGIFKASALYHPVINLILCDTSDNVLPVNKTLATNTYFSKFCDLLKWIYGVDVIVNFMVKEDNNPFLIFTETFINL